MASSGFSNDVLQAENVDFSGGFPVVPQMVTDGQLLIASTAAPNIRPGTLTSPLGTITVGYSSPNISLDLSVEAIDTINGDTGSITGDNVTIYANNATNNAGATVRFVNSGTTSTFNTTDAQGNTFIGNLSGLAGGAITFNTATGANSLGVINTGAYNNAFGANALASFTGGDENTAIGHNALGQLLTGQVNTAIGYQAGATYIGAETNNILINNNGTVGDNNKIRIGVTGIQNSTFIAGIAGVTVANTEMVTIDPTTGEMGSQALPSAIVETIAGDTGSITGDNVTIYANNAANNAGATVRFVNSGTTSTLNLSDVLDNTSLGRGSGSLSITTGQRNTSYGVGALGSVTSGTEHTAIGGNAGRSIVGEIGLTAVGYFAAQASIVPTTAIGWACLQSLTTGVNNTAVGFQSSLSLTTGTDNTSLGIGTLVLNSIGNHNTVVGAGAAQITTANAATVIGSRALQNCTTGNGNTAVGYLALFSITTGVWNTAIGYESGVNASGSSNIYLNHPGTAESNTMRLGLGGSSDGQINRTFIAGISGVTVANTEMVTIDTTTGQLGSEPMPTSGADLQTVTVTLTSQQIKNLHATPIEIIPAQGAGSVIVLISTIAKFNYGGSNVFVANVNQNIGLYYGIARVIFMSSFISNALLVSSTTAYQIYSLLSAAVSSSATSELENTAINAYNQTSTEISGNADDDNTITIVCKYYVVTI